jgi:pseudouridine synthase
VGVVSSTLLEIPFNIITNGNLSESALNIIKNCNNLNTIGRLDKDSCGLLLLTTDMSLCDKLTRTKNEEETSSSYGSLFEKKYKIKTAKYVSDILLDRIRNGVVITTASRRKEGTKNTRQTLPCIVTRLPSNKYELLVTLKEGRNRQIRKMFGSVGHNVIELQRISFGDITLDGLQGPGDILELTNEEKKSIGIIN